ncbi:MAG: serine hydrolase [Pseudomonadota bacterium]
MNAICGLMVGASALGAAYAENGAIGYAPPASGIVLDGDLSDWPDNAVRHPIETGVFDDGSGWRDEAFFRAAYDPSGEYLYLAVEVADESSVSLPGSNLAAEDAVAIFVDADHSWQGSASWAFLGEMDAVLNMSDEKSWDPQTGRATDESAELKVGEADGQRIYEWRIKLDQPVRAGMSIGFDVIVIDADEESLGHPPGFIGWGRFSSKTDRAGRLGDLVLLGKRDRVGTLTGDLAWGEGVDGPDLGGYRVRIRNRRNPDLWVTAAADEKGTYTVDLPVGSYCVTPAFYLYSFEKEYRIDNDVQACARVRRNRETTAPTLVKTVSPAPDHHIKESGVLFSFDRSDQRRLDAFMKDHMDHFTIPGAGVAIIRDGEIVYRQEYGVANWLTGAPVRPEHLFDVGSITKPVFAFAVMRLVEQGVLDLDRPLYEYMPFEDIAGDERSKLFTARYVLSHQTGLPNWRWQNDNGQLDLQFTPGEGYRYSGEGYDYLGRVVEKLTGEKLEDVLMREAVGTLGMSPSVRFSERDNWHDVFVNGHEDLRAHLSETPDEAHAAYSMMASASDLAQVLITWMNRGGGLSDEGYATMFEAQVETGETARGTAWKRSHGVGPQIIETPYGRAIGHGGLNWSQVSLMEFYEDQNAGFVIVTNGDDGLKVREALRRFLVAGTDHSVDPESEE